MFFIYNIIFPLAFLLYTPVLLVKLLRRGGLDRDYWQRFGFFSREVRNRLLALDRPVWIHAVSVGETVAALSFIARWRKRNPGIPLVLSSTTTTGHALAVKKLPEDIPAVYCPLDFPWAVGSALKCIRPRMLVIFEVEIWPNLILGSAGAGVKVVLVNGRVSDRSSRGYCRYRGFFARLFSAFSVICVQTEEDRRRLTAVAGNKVKAVVCNTMKFDQVPDTDGADKTAILDAAFGQGERTVFIAGSTHAGEEELVLKTFLALKPDFPSLRLVLVPRHQERTPEVVALMNRMGVRFRLLCPREDVPEPDGTVEVLVVNTTGELMNFYAAGDIVYVGKSLGGNTGGHNIIEPAIFGKPILHGVNMQNFREVAAIFAEAKAAVSVPGDAEFADALRRLLADPEARQALGARARAVVESCRGAIDRTLAEIEVLL